MNVLKPLFNWLGCKFEIWLQKVGEENCLDEHFCDHLPLESEFYNVDLMAWERND